MKLLLILASVLVLLVHFSTQKPVERKPNNDLDSNLIKHVPGFRLPSNRKLKNSEKEILKNVEKTPNDENDKTILEKQKRFLGKLGEVVGIPTKYVMVGCKREIAETNNIESQREKRSWISKKYKNAEEKLKNKIRNPSPEDVATVVILLAAKRAAIEDEFEAENVDLNAKVIDSINSDTMEVVDLIGVSGGLNKLGFDEENDDSSIAFDDDDDKPLTQKEKRFLKCLLKTIEEFLRIPSDIISKFTRSNKNEDDGDQQQQQSLIGQNKPVSETKDKTITFDDQIKDFAEELKQMGVEAEELEIILDEDDASEKQQQIMGREKRGFFKKVKKLIKKIIPFIPFIPRITRNIPEEEDDLQNVDNDSIKIIPASVAENKNPSTNLALNHQIVVAVDENGNPIYGSKKIKGGVFGDKKNVHKNITTPCPGKKRCPKKE